MTRCYPISILLLGLALVAGPATFPASAATLTVNTDQDTDSNDGFCSLREAITAANDDMPYRDCPTGTGADRIAFDLVLPATIQLTDHLPAITGHLRISGPGSELLALDGATNFRPIRQEDPLADGWLAVEDLTLTNGYTSPDLDSGGGAYIDSGETAIFRRVHFLANHSENGGGGLFVHRSTVSIQDCLFESNVAEGPAGGGGIGASNGSGQLSIVGSTLFDNSAAHENGTGGAIKTSIGTLIIKASTFSENEANSYGGAIFILSTPNGEAALVLLDSTLANNTSAAALGVGHGGGLSLFPGLAFPVTVTLQNSVIADNFDLSTSGALAPDISCVTTPPNLVASGWNFIGSNDSCEAFFPEGSPNSEGDYAGTSATPLNPLLQSLAFHGGETPVLRPSLNPLSPLVDQGGCPDAITDQRGRGNLATGRRPEDRPNIPNPGGDACDIGAFEWFTNSNSDPLIFADGFESGNTLLWSTEVLP
ncbi:MAG: CSLREA domain-containing protein [Deltaproteobacteria bacterium]|nr:CSLREA domain-containing protein [Deltaproteobacteria bacterium]